MKKQTSKGMILYEQVLQKNFEIIQTFLNKFPIIFKKQDYFQEAVKKINQKLNKHQNDFDKIREQIDGSISLLQKKIHAVKDSASRHSRSSIRASNQNIQQQRKASSAFKSSSQSKQNKQSIAQQMFSKEKAQLLNQINKKQEQSMQKMSTITQHVQKLSLKVNFLSKMTSKTQDSTDKIFSSMVDKSQFDSLKMKFQQKFEKFIVNLNNIKYQNLQKQLNERFKENIKQIQKLIQDKIGHQKQAIQDKISQKLNKTQFKIQNDSIKSILQRIVNESIEVFANKEETKKTFIFFQKKVMKFQTIIQQIMNQTLGIPQDDQERPFVNITRKNKLSMSSFGKKKSNNLKNTIL